MICHQILRLFLVALPVLAFSSPNSHPKENYLQGTKTSSKDSHLKLLGSIVANACDLRQNKRKADGIRCSNLNHSAPASNTLLDMKRITIPGT